MVFGCDFVADSPVILFGFSRSESVKPQTIEYAPSGKSVVLLDAGQSLPDLLPGGDVAWTGSILHARSGYVIEKEFGLDGIRESRALPRGRGHVSAGKLRSNR